MSWHEDLVMTAIVECIDATCVCRMLRPS